MAKKYPLTANQFDGLNVLTGWSINELPDSTWKDIPNLPRKENTISVMASGDCSSEILNGINSIVGIDVLVHETNPKPGEKPGNAYHMVIQKINDDKYPYLMHGPFNKQTVVPHHFEAEDLEIYFEQGTDDTIS
ncbi:hypothetical protein [Gimesia sp.]|uniref:hypothetical protein n=1 Tax=Gimesia sp. TaxID=2024833 RepID=UPI000C5826CC|nr:hypothetical protein [Gimesia sp.]MAX35339.1 hypothetical protein [Gimesia sp.]HAH46658.1 hypothetical protein [Planctomycetaceae bacterium]|tara:strand:- start:417 stop:818 length:402 start_codon:yes stop_codon:yes gene_type:complete